jgi:hypothetical protein
VSPDEVRASYRDALNSVGEPVSIGRYTGTGAARVRTDTTTKGYVRNYGANELIGSISQGDQVAVVLVDTLAGILPVTTNDKLIVGTKEFAIKNSMKRVVGGTLIALEIHAAG